MPVRHVLGVETDEYPPGIVAVPAVELVDVAARGAEAYTLETEGGHLPLERGGQFRTDALASVRVPDRDAFRLDAFLCDYVSQTETDGFLPGAETPRPDTRLHRSYRALSTANI